MYAGRVACSSMLIHDVYAPAGRTDGRTDARQFITLRFPLDAVNVKIRNTQSDH